MCTGVVIFWTIVIGLWAWPTASYAAESLVVYSGRAERLIKPVLDVFEDKTGITIQLLTSGSTELVNRLRIEGPNTPADVFITNDAGTLERARELRLLRPISMKEVERNIPPAFRAPDNSWIGLSGRIWVVVANTQRVQSHEISSILDVADPRWKGQLAIPNAVSEYLQAGVSVILALKGEAVAKKFLEGIKANAGNQVYSKNRQIVDAVAKGKVALGLVNHYYIYRHLAKHPQAPITPILTDQEEGGMGMIMNVAGVGVTAHAKHVDAAKRLVQFLVSQAGQRLFASLNKEYPLHPEVEADPALPPRDSFHVAQVPLTRLSELRDPTMRLIEQVGLR
ncbi:MAG: extracellular solute-binding protein [Nitrospirae bacterium]|nr:MAG: extracellular solute-binding protein [Nitrospirota bacterium]